MKTHMNKALKALRMITACGVMMTCSAAFAGTVVEHRSQVTVDGDRVMLSDLFKGIPADLDHEIAAAPEPGRAQIFSIAHLNRYARDYDLDWQAMSSRDSVKVTRAFETVPMPVVEGALHSALEAQGIMEDVAITLYNRSIPIQLPRGAVYDVTIDDFRYDAQTTHLRGSLVIRLDDGHEYRTLLNGRVDMLLTIPVPARTLMPNTIVEDDDIRWVSLPARRLSATSLTQLDQIVGKRTLRPLASGKLLQRGDLKDNILVSRNDKVTIIVETASMRLTATGKAKDQGARGDLIQVENLSTGRMIEATVSAAGIVVAGAAPSLALAN